MVDHQIDEDSNSSVVRLPGEADEIPERAQPRIDGIIIRDVVAVVTVGATVERQQPDAGGPERLDMVEPVCQALEIATAVTVGVHEGLHVDAINDGVLVPEIEHRFSPVPD